MDLPTMELIFPHPPFDPRRPRPTSTRAPPVRGQRPVGNRRESTPAPAPCAITTPFESTNLRPHGSFKRPASRNLPDPARSQHLVVSALGMPLPLAQCLCGFRVLHYMFLEEVPMWMRQKHVAAFCGKQVLRQKAGAAGAHVFSDGLAPATGGR